jgi:hypothetical protein
MHLSAVVGDRQEHGPRGIVEDLAASDTRRALGGRCVGEV